MDIFTKILCFTFIAIASAEIIGHNPPTIRWSCKPDSVFVTATFQKPFSGVIHARDYFARRFCSTSNMPARKGKVLKLRMPLLRCNNKVRDRGNYTQVRNTLIIRQHPMVKSVYDYAANISCRMNRKLSSGFWAEYKLRDTKPPPPPFRSWVEFRLGTEVFGEMEAKMLDVNHRIFLMVFVRDGRKHKSFRIRKCIVHDDEIIDNNTTIYTIAERNDCNGDLLNSLALKPDPKVSDLLGFSKISIFNISTKGNLFLSCGLDMCPSDETSCPEICPGKTLNNFTYIETHHIMKPLEERRKLGKRSADVPTAQDNGSSIRDLQTRNYLLRETLKLLGDRLLKVKEQQASQNKAAKLDRRVLRNVENSNVVEVTTNTHDATDSVIDGVTLPLNEGFLASELENASPLTLDKSNFLELETKFDYSKAAVELVKPMNCSDTACTFENITSINLDEILQNVTSSDIIDVSTVMDESFNKSVVNVTFNILDGNQEPATVNTTIFEVSGTEIVILSDKSTEIGTGILNNSSEDMSANNLFTHEVNGSNSEVADNSTEEIKLSSSIINTKSKTKNLTSCINKTKFISVTATLSSVSFCFFLLSIGLYLSLKKEHKKHKLDSYMLYNYF